MIAFRLLQSGVALFLGAAFLLLGPALARAQSSDPACDLSCYTLSHDPVNDTVACLGELDAYVLTELTASDTCTLTSFPVAQVLGNGADSTITSVATTALGIGPDGAIRMYGMAQSGIIDTDYFVETEVGLTLVQYANDVAILTGEVAAVTDADQRFEVFIVYENRVDGADWGGGFKHAMGCVPETDFWDIYTMKPDQSHLLGQGSLEGSLIRVTHAPSSQYFGFQVGQGANDHNCNYGAGGWFSWEGSVAGVSLAGAMGDVIVDLEGSLEFDPCEARSTAYYSAYVEDCGVLQATFDIVRHDDTAPVIAGVPADMVQSCEAPFPEPSGVSVTDDCPEPGFPALTFEGTFEIAPSDGHCRTYEQRWSAVDACGNTSEATRLIHLFDDEEPAMVGQDVLELECDAWPGGNEPPLAALIEAGIIDAVDNCELDTVLIDYGVMSGGCHYDHILQYTPIDHCGNVGSTFYQLVLIHDTTDPVFVGLPADTTVSCATDPLSITSVPTAEDNCDPDVEVSVEAEMLDDGDGCPETYILQRVFTASDCGYNHAMDTQWVHVVDTAAPQLVLLPPADVTESGCFGEVDISVATLGSPEVTVTDDCGEVTQSLLHSDEWTSVCSNGDGQEGGSATLERTWTLTASDCAGNTASLVAVQTITVVDDEAPVVSGAPVVNLPCADWQDGFSGAEALAAGFLTASDNCLLDSVSVSVLTELSGGCSGTFEVAYTAVDACGLTATLGQIVQLYDSVAPVFTELPEDGVLSCDGDPLPYTVGEAAASDDCGDVQITTADELVLDGCASTAVWERTITATDDCGNQTHHIQVFQRQDNVPPVLLEVPGDTTTGCVLPPFDATSVLAEDDCDAAPVISHVDDTVSFSCASGFVVERHILATDCAGNVGEAVQTLTVQDTTAPTLTTSGVLVELTCTEWTCDIDLLVEAGFVSAEDNCGSVDLSVECLAMSGGCIEPFGTYTLLYTAADPCGNLATAEQILTLVDLEAPALALTCADSATFEMGADCAPAIDAPAAGTDFEVPTVSVTDNCDDAPDWTLTFEDGPATSSCGTGGHLMVERTHTLTAEDRCGNVAEASCVQILTFLDVHGPELEVVPPADLAFPTCLTATDTSLTALGMPDVVATDACGGDVVVTVDHADVVLAGCAGDDDLTEGSSTLERTFTITATDCVGNATVASVTQVVSFTDTEAPTLSLTCPADTVMMADPDCGVDSGTDILGWPATLATDNCDTDVALTLSFVDVESAGECAGARTIERTFTATAVDDCGLTTEATCTQTISVVDDIAPTAFLTCPDDAEIVLDANCSWDGDSGQPDVSVADGCDPDPVVSLVHVDHDTVGVCAGDDALPEGSLQFIRTWTLTATDACGNATTLSCDQQVTLLDQSAPDVHELEVLPSDTLYLDADCMVDLTPTAEPTASAEDGCDSDVALELTHEDGPATALCADGDGAAEGSHSILRTWRSVATDDCGNRDTVETTQLIVVLDAMAPQWTETCGLANGEVVELGCAGEGVLDFDPFPVPCVADAEDECDSEVEIERTDALSDHVPLPEACNLCAPSDPEPVSAGLTCDGAAPESMRLYNFNGVAEASFVLDGISSRMDVDCDSTLHLTLHLTDGNGGGFTYDAAYIGGWDWAAWSGDDHPFAPAIAGSYKLDCPEILPGQPVWLDWHYFYLAEGTLSGTGTYAGTELLLAHQPANAFFGFQVGLGANNKNDLYGASGWFQWEGQLVVDGEDLGAFASSGDVFMDLDCCLPWEAQHTYVAQDDCGNAVSFSYTVVNTGEPGSEGAGLSGGPVHQGGPVVLGGLADKQPFQILGLMPNPTSDIAHLQFEVESEQRLTVRLHTMNGTHVLDLFDAMAEVGIVYQLPIDVDGLSSGLYQLRISGTEHSEVRKLLVSQ